MTTPLLCKNAQVLRNRFGLNQGQFFATYAHKNLWWELNGEFFGFGDITSEQVFHIQNQLDRFDTFRGWNEHHGSEWQQTDLPMVEIKRGNIKTMRDLLDEAAADLAEEKRLEEIDEYHSYDT